MKEHPGWRLLGLRVRRAASSFPRFAEREQIQTCRVWTRLCFGILMKMELFQAKDHFILQSGDNALWCSRKDGSMTVRPGNAFIFQSHHFVTLYMCYICTGNNVAIPDVKFLGTTQHQNK